MALYPFVFFVSPQNETNHHVVKALTNVHQTNNKKIKKEIAKIFVELSWTCPKRKMLKASMAPQYTIEPYSNILGYEHQYIRLQTCQGPYYFQPQWW
jgi:hypothetical protein